MIDHLDAGMHVVLVYKYMLNLYFGCLLRIIFLKIGK